MEHRPHRRLDDEIGIPATLKYLLVFIDRAGFPVVAFCLMTYICFISLEKVRDSLDRNTIAITRLVTTLEIGRK